MAEKLTHEHRLNVQMCGNGNMLNVTTDFKLHFGICVFRCAFIHEKELTISSSYRLVHAALCENSILVLKRMQRYHPPVLILILRFFFFFEFTKFNSQNFRPNSI